MPRYLGSSDTRIVAIPVVALQHGIFYADVVRGVGAEYSTESGFYISSALGYDEGRSTQNSTWQPGSKKLAGMGEIKGSMTFSVVAAQQLTSWLSVTAAGEFLLEGQQDRGNQYSLGLDVDLLDTKQDTITVALGAHAGDRNYNQTYFGVTHAQAQNSRFSRFDADSGIYGYSITGDWSHRFDEHWSVMTAVRVMRLAGDASNSPLTEEKTAITGIASINYSF
jgi:outer membrane protein